MARRTLIVAAIALALGATSLFAQTQTNVVPNIAGTWVLVPDSAASAAGGRGRAASSLLGLGPNATITQDATTLSITRTSPAGAVTSKYNLDGSVSRNTFTFGTVTIEPVSRVKVDGGKVAITTTMDVSGSVYETSMSLWTDATGTLVVHTTTPGSPGGAAPTSMIARYRKADTLHLSVGSPQIKGSVYRPHAARVRVRVGEGAGQLTAEWTNELTLGDSAGRRVMRWVTTGTRFQPNGDTVRWVLRQTYDAMTLAVYGYTSESSNGAFARLRVNDRRVTGTRRLAGSNDVQTVDQQIDQPGFFGGASDLVPLAVGLRVGNVMTAPFWTPNSIRAEMRVFTVLSKSNVNVEGTNVSAWKVEERRRSDRALIATWYLTEESPYMVYGEVPLPNGQIQRMTEVPIR